MDGPSRLYLFSDGAYEVEGPDEDMWTLEDIEQYLSAPPEGTPEMDSLYAFLQQKRGMPELEDDFSIMKVLFD